MHSPHHQTPQAAEAAKAAAAVSGEEAAAAAATRGAFEGAISEAFEPALKHYVSQEQREVRVGRCGRALVFVRRLNAGMQGAAGPSEVLHDF